MSSDVISLLKFEKPADAILARGREVIRLEANGLADLESALGETFVSACQTILDASRQLIVTGMGKSGHVARKIAATFAATGTPAIYVHPAEASHGDLGMIRAGDVLLVLSISGNTSELRSILNFARCNDIAVIGVSAKRNSLVMELANIPIKLPDVEEACLLSHAPTTSTTMQLALGDALAMTVMDMRGVSRSHLRSLHPSGSIGLALTPVEEIMRRNGRMPLVNLDTRMPEAISVMTTGCCGLAGVTDRQSRLIGVITDGDLRRRFGELTTALAHEVMTKSPKTIPIGTPASDVLIFLNDNQITAAFIVGDPGLEPQMPLGIIHIHDLLRHGLN